MVIASGFNVATANDDTNVSSSTQLAALVLRAFQHTSADEYAALLPAFSDFNTMMTQNARFYGANLDEAKNDFASTYITVVVPAVRESFNAAIAQGKNIGINWESIQLQDIQIKGHSEKEFSVAAISIVFTSAGKQYTLFIDKAIVINGKWNISQHVTLTAS